MTIMPIQQVMMMASAILSQGNDKKPDIPALSEHVDRLTRAVDFWNGFMMAGLVIAAIAALWLALSTRLTIVRQKELTIAQEALDSAKEGELQIQLTAANLKRIELQNRILDIFGPRQLTVEQSAGITKKLARLKGAKIDVYVFKFDNPYNRKDFDHDSDLGKTLVRTLTGAGIDAELWLLESCQDNGASNLVVGVVGNDPHDLTIAKRVADALPEEIGVWPVVEPNFFSDTCKFSSLDPSMPNKRTHDAKVSIAIGKKIQPILTPEMLGPPDEQNKP